MVVWYDHGRQAWNINIRDNEINQSGVAGECLFRKSGFAELFSAMQIGVVKMNKLHKSGSCELVNSQTANFDINALFICLFFANFNCKAYNYLKRLFLICVSERKIKCFNGFTRIKYCKSE